MRTVTAIVMFVVVMLAACSSCGSMSSERRHAVARAEAACALDTATRLASKLAAARAAGHSANRTELLIELLPGEVACALAALAAQPKTEKAVEQAAGSALPDAGVP
jgi:hypothetical protein